MSDRKTRVRNAAHPYPLGTNDPTRRRIPPDAFPGNAETHLTPAEWGRMVDAVWEQGRALPDADPGVWRQDSCGAWMRRDQFGQEESEFGWRIEKIAPGPAATANLLRPFHWRNHYDIANRRACCDTTADRSGMPTQALSGPPRNKPS